jgi:hypothetical protein
MAAQAPPPAQPNPPPVPPGVDPSLNSYLTQFSVWATQGLTNSLSSSQALPGILLSANDAPAGTNPAVFMIQVTTAGAIVATPVALGAGGAKRL